MTRNHLIEGVNRVVEWLKQTEYLAVSIMYTKETFNTEGYGTMVMFDRIPDKARPESTVNELTNGDLIVNTFVGHGLNMKNKSAGHSE